MNIKRSLVEKIRVEDIIDSHRLDPVEILIENFENGAGKIVVNCTSSSWTGYWSSMGGTVEQFFQRVSNDYLIGKMSQYQHSIPDPDEDSEFLLRATLRQRRSGIVSQEDARVAFDYIHTFSPDRSSLHYGGTPEALEPIIGDEPWYMDWPEKPCPEYAYLSRILNLVRDVINPSNTAVDTETKENL